MLPRHPDALSLDELTAWIDHLVDDQVEEGKSLDYKELRGLDKDDYPEIAKDVTSFANEIGGTILYGIPEKRTADGRPIPDKPYGVDRIPSFESRFENVIVDAIKPTLPDYRIKEIPVAAGAGKVVYLVWVSQSWVGVHMVQAYRDQRYYRRGEYRAVPMTEEEVRQRYDRILAARGWVESFLSSPEISYIEQILPRTFASHYVICPLLPQSIDFTHSEARHWLRAHPSPSGHFLPSPHGVRAPFVVQGDRWQPLTEIHSNGVMVQWSMANVDTTSVKAKTVHEMEFVLAHGVEFQQASRFLDYGAKLYEFIGYTGPIRVSLKIAHLARLHHTLYLPVGNFPSQWPSLFSPDNELMVAVDSSAATLVADPNGVLKELADGLYQSFGIWEGSVDSYLY